MRDLYKGYHVVGDELPSFSMYSEKVCHQIIGEVLNKIFMIAGVYDSDTYMITLDWSVYENEMIKDSILKSFSPHIKNSIGGSPIFVSQKDWTDLTGQHHEGFVGPRKKSVKLCMQSFVSPNIFKGTMSTFLMSADVKYHPVLNRIWPVMFGAKLEEQEDFKQYLRYSCFSETNIPERLQIIVGFEDNYTKTGRIHAIDGNKNTKFNYLKRLIKNNLKDTIKPCIVQNNDLLSTDNGDIRTYHDSSVQLSSYAFGMNSYMDSTGIGFNISLNHSTNHRNMLVKLGYTNEDLSFQYTSAVMQTLMRVKLRDIDSNDIVKAVVPDMSAAKGIIKYMNSSKVCLDTSYTIKKTRKTDSDTIKKPNKKSEYSLNQIGQISKELFLEDKESRFYREVEKKYAELFPGLISDKYNLDTIENPEKNCAELFPENQSFDIPRNQEVEDHVTFSVLDSFYSKKSILRSSLPSDLHNILKTYSKHNVCKDKAKAGMISPVIHRDQGRSLATAEGYSRFLILDHDSNDKTIDEALKIYRKEYGRSIELVESRSASDVDNRYHVYLYLKEGFSELEAKLFFKHNQHILETKHGWKNHGLDTSRYNVGAFFNLPSIEPGDRARRVVKGFKVSGDIDDPLRCIDLKDIIKNSGFIKEKIRLANIQTQKSEELMSMFAQKTNKRLESVNSVRAFIGVAPVESVSSSNELYSKILSDIELLEPGNRSVLACSIAGKAKYLDDHWLKQDVYARLVCKGIDESAQRSVKEYMLL